jgi:hypothetical protein
MINLQLIIITMLGYIFLTSCLSKLSNVQSHYLTISAYKVVPDRFVYSITLIDITVEFITALTLIFGIFLKISLFNSVLLLLTYSTAILINLLRGRTELECGCGGVVGNKKISNSLIVRNVGLLLISLIFILQTDFRPFYFEFDSFFWIVQSMAILVSLTVMTLTEANIFSKHIKNI